MGGQDFYNEGAGKNARDAFYKIRERYADHSWVAEGYSGTIGESHDFVMAKFSVRPTKKNFQNQIEEKLEDWDKYGPCLCWEFTGVMAQEARKRHNIPKGSRSKVFAFFGIAPC